MKGKLAIKPTKNEDQRRDKKLMKSPMMKKLTKNPHRGWEYDNKTSFALK